MNKKERIRFINHFGKPAYKFYMNFPRLFTICELCNIPYDFVSRCYRRYKSIIRNDEIMNSLENDGYLRYWFGNSKDDFENAIRMYISNKISPEELGCKDYKYKKYTRGDVQILIAKLCDFDKYFMFM